MLGVSRRLVATVGAAATILMLTTTVVAAADPVLRPPPARTVRPPAPPSYSGLKRTTRDRSGCGSTTVEDSKPPATDIELAPIAAASPVSGIGIALTTWVLVFAAGVLASLRYLARRSRL